MVGPAENIPSNLRMVNEALQGYALVAPDGVPVLVGTGM
jgi:hypothetical protein